MDKIQELLPGIEEFLTTVLGSETLSGFAEERRQFFLERLDIVKLPPSVPPREGRVLPLELLKESEQLNGVFASKSLPDFAAVQRAISRTLINPDLTEDLDHDGDRSWVGNNTKDDTDIPNRRDASFVRQRSASEDNKRSTFSAGTVQIIDIEDNGLYEIPLSKEHPSNEDNSFSCTADASSLATTAAESSEELSNGVGVEAASISTPSVTSMTPPTYPPPPPPVRDSQVSDSCSRDSVSEDDKPPELPFRPRLARRSEIYTRSEKSDRSENEKSTYSDLDISGDGDSTSYESFDEDNDHRDNETVNKMDVPLPKKFKKKSKLKRSSKIRKSGADSGWEVNVPFRKLENVVISGELFHKGKLSWSRRVVAIANGRMILYKAEREGRPTSVITLSGFESSLHEKEGKKGYEIKMVHADGQSHVFSVEFKEWGHHWVEHINGSSRGQPPPKHPFHLARSVSEGSDYGSSMAAAYGNKFKDTCISYPKGFDVQDSTLSNNKEELTHSNTSVIKDQMLLTTPRNPDLVVSSRITRYWQSEKSPRNNRKLASRSLKFSATEIGKDKSLGATVRDILRRRQKAVYKIYDSDESLEPDNSMHKTDMSCPKKVVQGMELNLGLTTQMTSQPPVSTQKDGPVEILSAKSLPRNTKSSYGRCDDLTGSNSNLSAEDDCPKEKAKSKKVTRMGSFAYRATQFLENIGKKNPTVKKKARPNSSPSLRNPSEVRPGAAEPDTSLLAVSAVSPLAVSPGPLSAGHSPALWSPGYDSGVTSTSSLGDAGSTLLLSSDVGHDVSSQPLEEHHGYLSVFSTFKKRCWGRRWCLVRDNSFQCYKTEDSRHLELSFPLRTCLLRRAVVETGSPLGLMLLEGDREKITVQILSRPDMGPWVRVLLRETSTIGVPPGLEVFLEEHTHETFKFDAGSHVSIHHYEDPEETLAAAAKLQMTPQTPPEAVPALVDNTIPALVDNTIPAQVDNTIPAQVDNTIPPASVAYTSRGNKVTCTPPVQRQHKPTTDSGFYSVRGANSDSDSSSENCSPFLAGKHYIITDIDISGSDKLAPSHAQNKKEPAGPDINANNLIKPTSKLSPQSNSCMSSSLATSPSKLESTSATVTLVSNTTSPPAFSSPPLDRFPQVHPHDSSAKNPESPSDSSSITNDTCVKTTRSFSQTCRHTHVTSSKTSSLQSVTLKNSRSDTQASSEYSVVLKRSERHSKTFTSTTIDTKAGAAEPAGRLISSSSSGPSSPDRSSTRIENDVFRENIVGEDKCGFISDLGGHLASMRSEELREFLLKTQTNLEDAHRMIDSLKTKQTDIKRKRMAVHDKRQRVLSDEERLACEREFAALEQLAQSTDQGLRILQNYMNEIRGPPTDLVRSIPDYPRPASSRKKT